MFSHTFETLKNGLPVIRIPMPGVNSVTVLALANTGSRYETPEHQGIAHFFEHMVFKGTHSFPTAAVLATAVDGVGANFNAFTSKEYTGYYVKAASRHLALALDVVSDMLLTPMLRQDDIDREKGVIIEEIHMYEDTPSRHVANLFERMVFQGSGLEHDIIGTPETVSALTSADFQGFLERWYGLPNLVLVLAGDAELVSKAETLQLAEEMFSKEMTRASGDRVTQKVDVTTELSNQAISDKQKLLVHHKQTEQAHFILAWPGLKRGDARRYALSLLSTILGGNMSSRLFMEVREQRGLAYYVNADVDLYHDTGLFGASAGVDPKRVEEALKVTVGEFTGLVDGSKPVTEAELARAKEYASGKMALGFEDSESVAQFYGMRQLLSGKIETPEEVLQKLKAVTLDEVTSIAKELLESGDVRFAVIGPYKDQAPFEQILV